MTHSEKITRIFVSAFSVITMILLYIFRERVGFTVAIFAVVEVVILGFAVGPFISEFLGKQSGSLYTGSKRADQIPHLSEAEAAMKRQEFTRAKELYIQAQEQFPTFLPLYSPLFDILTNRLHEYETARTVYRIGWLATSGESRKKLEHLFSEYPKSPK